MFKAYTYGAGEYLVTGGRYDKLLVQFGKDTPAVGFAIVVDRLMQALSRQRIVTKVDMVEQVILYEPGARREAIRLAKHFREEGRAVQMIRKTAGRSVTDYVSYAGRQRMRLLLYLSNAGEQVSEYQVESGRLRMRSVEDYYYESSAAD